MAHVENPENDVVDFSEIELEDIEKYVTKERDKHDKQTPMGHWKHIARFGNQGWKKFQGNSKERIDDILENKETSILETNADHEYKLKVKDRAMDLGDHEINEYLDKNQNSVRKERAIGKKKVRSKYNARKGKNNAKNPFVDGPKVNVHYFCDSLLESRIGHAIGGYVPISGRHYMANVWTMPASNIYEEDILWGYPNDHLKCFRACAKTFGKGLHSSIINPVMPKRYI